MNGNLTTRIVWLRSLIFILVCLLMGAQFVPRPGQFTLFHKSSYHRVEHRVVRYGWPVTLYSAVQYRQKTGLNGKPTDLKVYELEHGGFIRLRSLFSL